MYFWRHVSVLLLCFTSWWWSIHLDWSQMITLLLHWILLEVVLQLMGRQDCRVWMNVIEFWSKIPGIFYPAWKYWKAFNERCPLETSGGRPSAIYSQLVLNKPLGGKPTLSDVYWMQNWQEILKTANSNVIGWLYTIPSWVRVGRFFQKQRVSQHLLKLQWTLNSDNLHTVKNQIKLRSP